MGRVVSYTRVERAKIGFPRTRLSVDVPVAVSQAARTRGLHGRPAVAPTDGMLFLFETEAPVMTMTGMLTALDFIFLDRTGKILMLAPDVHPGVPRVTAKGLPARYVLELGPGFLRQTGHGTQVGDTLSIWRYHTARS